MRSPFLLIVQSRPEPQAQKKNVTSSDNIKSAQGHTSLRKSHT
jgi:hypothetical protein